MVLRLKGLTLAMVLRLKGFIGHGLEVEGAVIYQSLGVEGADLGHGLEVEGA